MSRPLSRLLTLYPGIALRCKAVRERRAWVGYKDFSKGFFGYLIFISGCLGLGLLLAMGDKHATETALDENNRIAQYLADHNCLPTTWHGFTVLRFVCGTPDARGEVDAQTIRATVQDSRRGPLHTAHFPLSAAQR